MNRTPVQSSRVKSIGWEPIVITTLQGSHSGVLEVEFIAKDGKENPVYQYSPISEETFDNLLTSYQLGKDIQQIIGDKSILCVKISPVEQNEGGKPATEPKWQK